jgi:hypothetical protein
MGGIVITESKSPPPIGITPPWVIIRVGVGWVVIFRPEINLFARKKGIPILHFTEKLDLLPENLTCHRDFPTLLKEVRIQILIGEN